MKVMCMYLPQYHTFPENDEWWGKGYTEWVAVKRGRPLYKGHMQPRVPLDNRYYDLDKDGAATLEWQAELAKRYNIYGFAIYQYYFKGKTLMDGPLKTLLNNPQIDIRYNLCWANESWTRTWYGLSDQVLMAQEYGDEKDWREYFEYMLPFFRDPRYIKVDNKPVYQIYKTFDIPCFEQMAECFNRWAKEAGYDGIYFISAKTAAGCEERSECKRLIDGYYYFEPGFSLKFGISPAKKFAYNVSVAVNSAINKLIKDENKKRLERRIPAEWIYSAIQERTYEKDEFPGLIPDWDNTPRRSYKGLIYKGTSPKRFGEVLRSLIEKTRTKETAGENTENAVLEDAPGFIYINAWNEWGEGAYIEPDKYRGEEYLRKIKENVNC